MATETNRDKRKVAPKAAPKGGKGAKAAKPDPDEEEEAEEDDEEAEEAEEAGDDEAGDEDDEEPAPKGAKGKAGATAAAKPMPVAAPKKSDLSKRIDEAKEKTEKYITEQSEKLVVDEGDLSGECKVQASSFLAAAARHNTASYNLQLAKAEYDSRRASESLKIRDAASASGEKITEGLIESKLATNAAVQEAAKKVAFCNYQKDQYGSVQRAFEHKRDMLIQLGSTERAAFRAETTVSDGPVPGPKGKKAPPPKPADDDEDDAEEDDTDDAPVTRRAAPAKAAATAKPKPKSKPKPVDDDEDDEQDDED